MFTFGALIIALVGQLTPLQAPGGSIEGIVIRLGTTDPIAAADVELTRVEAPAVTADPAARTLPGAPPPTVFRASTGDDGKFLFKSIPAGRYRLVATRAGGALSPAEYGQRDLKDRGTTFELAGGQNLSGVRLTMAPTGAITGRVWDADQDPLPNARVLALESIYQNGRRILNTVQAVRTNDLGEYRLFWLRPGRYYVAVMRQDVRTFSFLVHVTPPDQFGKREDASSPLVRERQLEDGRSIEETAVLVYFGGGTDERTAQAVDVLPGATVAAVDVRLQAGFVESRRVKGMVIGADGQPAGGAQVRLVPVQSAPHVTLSNALADKKGGFTLTGVVPGSYYLVSTVGASTGWNFNESLLDVGNGSSSTIRLEVADRDLENVSVTLKPSFTVAGRVHLEGNAVTKWDVTQARIAITRDPNLLGLPNAQGLGANRQGQRPNGAPSDDGRFVFAGLGQGEYGVSVTGIPTSAYVKAIQLGGVDVLRNGLRLENAPETPLDILLHLEGATLEGVATNEKSEPVSNATIALIPDIPSRNSAYLYRSSTSDASGAFEIKGIAPGTYKVFAWESLLKGAWQDPDVIRNVEAYGTPITFLDGGRQQLRLTVAPQK